MKRLFCFALAAFIAFSTPTRAQSPVVVELFTSQGCSSCPPADRILQELATREDVIALALHVDYWDYIGWKDVFAQSRFSERQRQYARQGGRHSVYTPQMVINGITDVVGAKPMKISEAIAKHAALPSQVKIELQAREGQIRITGHALQDVSGPMRVQMMQYTPHSETRITRGENAGKTLSYSNIVKEIKTLGPWDGAQPLTINAPYEDGMPVVVLVQNEKSGLILGAARLR